MSFLNINEPIFREGTPLRTDISPISLGGCFRGLALEPVVQSGPRSQLEAFQLVYARSCLQCLAGLYICICYCFVVK